RNVTGVQTCALPIFSRANPRSLTYCLQQVSGILEELPSHTAPDAAPRDLVAELQTVLAEVNLREITHEHEELATLLEQLMSGVHRLARAIRQQQFGSLVTALWTAETDGNEVAQ